MATSMSASPFRALDSRHLHFFGHEDFRVLFAFDHDLTDGSLIERPRQGMIDQDDGRRLEPFQLCHGAAASDDQRRLGTSNDDIGGMGR